MFYSRIIPEQMFDVKGLEGHLCRFNSTYVTLPVLCVGSGRVPGCTSAVIREPAAFATGISHPAR